MLEFQILGPLEVTGDDGPLRLGGLKQRATLALLLLDANRLVSVDRLADALYAGAPPATAVTQVQRQISELRKLGLGAMIETRSPGYLIRLLPDQLDLDRFERQTEEASQALARGEAVVAARMLREALALWRGSPLADLAYEPFAQTAIERLEELRLAALEQRIEADLVLGHHAKLVVELEALVFEHPLRERLRRQLMLALYRSGRQAEALDAYRTARAVLVEELGIEPTPALRELERAILRQDPTLNADPAAPMPALEADRAVLVLPSDEWRLDDLLSVAQPLARLPGRELIIVRLLGEENDVQPASDALNARRATLDVRARTAAFTTVEVARDAVRLATTYDVDLVLLDAASALDTERPSHDLAAILERSPADVAVLSSAHGVDIESGDGVYIPFGGGEHDWTALEVGAWLASGAGLPLRLVGTRGDRAHGRRDASRLLATASLAVQRVIGVTAEPILAGPVDEELVSAVEPATVVVVGISPRWRQEGLGASRRTLIDRARASVLLVHTGPRPGGLAPRDSRTRFTWSIAA